MCGIGSITFTRKVNTQDLDVEAGISALLSELDSRGKDACGLMSISAKGRLHTQKASCRAFNFNKGRIPVGPEARAIAVHTRFATQGDASFMRNNHPVQAVSHDQSDQAFVIHNGVVDDRAVPRLQGHPEVDTYALALAALPHARRAEGETVRKHAIRIAEAMAAIEGSAAVQVAFQGVPMLVSAKFTGSPLYSVEVDGVRVTASTQEACRRSAKAMGLTIPMADFWVPVKKNNKPVLDEKGEPMREIKQFEDIDWLEEGRVLIWNGAGHGQATIKMPERSAQPKSWRRYFETGDPEATASSHTSFVGTYGTGSGSRSSQNRESWNNSSQQSPAGGWGEMIGRTEETKGEIVTSTCKYASGWQTVTRTKVDENGKRTWLSSTTVPPVGSTSKGAAYRREAMLGPAEVAGKELYPEGTPWPPVSEEGEQFARHFLLWRRSSHGLAWARSEPSKAKAYDDAAARRHRNKLTPPFPAPIEVEAMLKDPLFTREVASETGVAVTDGVLNKAVETMLRNVTSESKLPVCDMCGKESAQVRAIGDDGDLCPECELTWLWSEYQAR